VPVERARFDARLRGPCCVFGIRVDDGHVAEIAFLSPKQQELEPRNALAERAVRQLSRYLRDPDYRFDLPLKPAGTDFQRRVWAHICAIPAGATRSYGAIAADLRSAARAVGQACGENPLPVVVPCHRVVAAKGLGGFAHREGGFLLDVKRWLLEHEGSTVQARLPL
jgi:methylated-DNA-[protein]-cysteine S-methyltransferase